MEIENTTSSSVTRGKDDSSIELTSDSKQSRVEKRRRMGLFVFSAITGALYAGAFFAYGPMQLLLEAHGVFEQLCTDGEATPCPAQTARLLTVQFVAQFAIVFSPILGVIADRYGPLQLMNFAAVSGCLGLGLLSLATGLRIDNLVFVAFFLIGVMAMSSAVNTVQVGMLFEPVTRQRVISALNTLFDAGLLTYLVLWAIYEWTGCSVPALIAGYLCGGVICFGGSIYYWRVAVPVDDFGDEDIDKEVTTAPAETVEQGIGKDTVLAVTDETSDIENKSAGQSYTPEDLIELGIPDKPDSNGSSADGLSVGSSHKTDIASCDEDDYVLVADRPPMQQLKSKQFVTLTTFFAIHATRDVFNLTTARDFLAYLGDDETGNKYLTIYTLLTPASILGLPLLDFVLTRYGYQAGLQTVNILALAQGIIMCSSDNLNVQVLGFIFASFFRCFMYTISLGILPTFLGVKAVGKASGIMPCAAGILALVNIPLASWAVNDLGGNFFWPNLIFTLLVAPCTYLAWVLGRGLKREDAIKKRMANTKET